MSAAPHPTATRDEFPAADPAPGGALLRDGGSDLNAAQSFEVPVGRVTGAVAAVALALAIVGLLTTQTARLDLTDPWWSEVEESFVRLFSLDLEANVPTWFSSSLLLACGGLAAVIACLRAGASERGRWALMSVLYLGLSIDETAIIHEMSIKPMRQLLPTGGYLYYGWVIPAAGLVLLVALYYWRFVVALPGPARGRLIVGAGLYVSGALVVEGITGRIAEQEGFSLAYELAAVVEESLEIAGLVVMMAGLLAYLRSRVGRFEVRVLDRRP